MYCEYIQLWIGNENRGNFHWLELTKAIIKTLEETVKKEKKNEETEEIETLDTSAVSDLEEEPAEEEQKIDQDNQEPWGRKTEQMDLEVAEEEREKASMYFEMALKNYGDYDKRTRKQKVLIVALDLLIHNLRVTDNGYKREIDQPELPKFKNNDQRKEWLRNYKDWGLWYTDRNINVNYYKYDFADGSRLVVTEYPDRIMEWNGEERRDSYHFHLLEKNKKAYGNKKTYDKQYVHAPDSETYLVEFLKWLQKKA